MEIHLLMYPGIFLVRLAHSSCTCDDGSDGDGRNGDGGDDESVIRLQFYTCINFSRTSLQHGVACLSWAELHPWCFQSTLFPLLLFPGTAL